MNEKLVEKIISVSYGDANIFDKLYINILAIKNKEVMNLLTEYKNTAKEVHSLNEDKLPESSVEKIYNTAGIKTAGRLPFISDIFSVFVTKPLVASAAVFVLAGLLVTSLFIKNHETEVTYTQTEIENAGIQTQKVFQAINDVFSEAKTLVKDNVLKERVAKPINESYNKISKMLKEGEIK